MSYQFEDQQLTCADCGREFTFTAEDQEFYSAKGYSAPKRCPECRAARKAHSRGGHSRGGTVKDNSLKLHAATADARQRFRLSPKEIDRFTALTATRICRIKAGSDG